MHSKKPWLRNDGSYIFECDNVIISTRETLNPRQPYFTAIVAFLVRGKRNTNEILAKGMTFVTDPFSSFPQANNVAFKLKKLLGKSLPVGRTQKGLGIDLADKKV